MKSGKMRYNKEEENECTICGRVALVATEMHHIIPKWKIKEASKRDLLYILNKSNTSPELSIEEIRRICINETPKNVVELCRKCHSFTESNILWQNGKRRKSRSRPWIGKAHAKRWKQRGAL